MTMESDELYALCERIYRETGGVTPKLREAYEFYLFTRVRAVEHDMKPHITANPGWFRDGND